jgi:Domain of unknown function (DU1801)
MPNTSSMLETQISEFIDRFEPKAAKIIRQCRQELRKLLPTATELIYDNYNFFVIGYCSSAKPSSCVVSLAAAANGVGLSFYHGATLKDPDHLLQGAGKQNRFIRLPSVEALHVPGVLALIKQAVKRAPLPLPRAGGGSTIIQSVSAKQKPRRKASNDL